MLSMLWGINPQFLSTLIPLLFLLAQLAPEGTVPPSMHLLPMLQLGLLARSLKEMFQVFCASVTPV